MMVDAINDRRIRVLAGSRDENTFCPCIQMREAFFPFIKFAGTFQHDVDPMVAMRNVDWVTLAAHMDFTTANIHPVSAMADRAA